MKVYTGRIPAMSKEILDTLTADEHIEVVGDMIPEVELDINAVLREYVRVDREITDQSRDEIAEKELPYNHLYKVKKKKAEVRAFGIGDDSVDYLTKQLIEMFLHTNHVDEVFAEDHEMRLAMRPILQRHMSMDSELDQEVRNRIKNLQEGTSDWDIEYKKTMENLKEAKKLT